MLKLCSRGHSGAYLVTEPQRQTLGSTHVSIVGQQRPNFLIALAGTRHIRRGQAVADLVKHICHFTKLSSIAMHSV